MQNYKLGIFGLLSLLSSGLSAPAAHAAVPLWVDLNDVVLYSQDKPEDMQEAKNIRAYLDPSAAPEEYLQDGETPHTGLFVQSRTENSKSIDYTLAFRVGTSQGGDFFRIFSISYDKSLKDILGFKVLHQIPLADTAFSIYVGLVQREVLVEDEKDGIRMLFPLGVGGVDPGVAYPGSTSILTPLFHNATVRRDQVDLSVGYPTYYRNEPFLSITDSAGETTLVGFHISILSDDEWASKGGSFLYREFVSHACMRLRKADLENLTQIIMQGGSTALPVDVDYFILGRKADGSVAPKAAGPLLINHPYPLGNDSYQAVENFGSGSAPEARRDTKEHLLILETKSGLPDFSQLDGFQDVDRVNLNKYNLFLGL